MRMFEYDILPETRVNISRFYRFQWEEAQNSYVLLYPEGMIKVNFSAAAILDLCKGQTVAEIIAQLENTYFDVPTLSADVYEFLGVAYDNGWVTFSEPA